MAHRSFLESLRCPGCLGPLALQGARESRGEVEAGVLCCAGCGGRFPIEGFVPRFTGGGGNVDSFGFQWNRFRTTQLDSRSGVPISRDRFFRQTEWDPEELAGKRILDVGCGAGRFGEIALGAGAHVVGIDASSSVDACWANLGPHPRLNVVQADLYRMPFEPGSFDYAYCFGVLQHTPEIEAAFVSVTTQVRPGGRVAVDVYPKSLATFFWPKYWLRPITRRLPTRLLFPLVQALVPALIPLRRLLGRVPVIGRKLRYAIPILDYEGSLPLSKSQLEEWAILDTFDMYAPAHDHPQTEKTVRAWFEHADLQDIEIFRSGFLVGRGVKRPSRRTRQPAS
jgi:SAM-dependent methyltransferase